MKLQDLALAAFLVVCGWTPGIAQPPDEANLSHPPLAPPREEGRPGERGPARFLESLPPEMRERFERAREKALQDPKLQELRKNAEWANREFFRAIRDKMLEIDPGLADIVRERAYERKARKAWRDDGGTPGFGGLSDDEREKLIGAREKAKSDPAVQAAEKRKREANTVDERYLASEDYRKALHEAMLRADPSIAPILGKLAPKPSPPQNPPDAQTNRPMVKEPQ